MNLSSLQRRLLASGAIADVQRLARPFNMAVVLLGAVDGRLQGVTISVLGAADRR